MDKANAINLSPEARQLTLAAANIVYDPKGVEQIKVALENTKDARAIAPTVAMLGATILNRMGEKAQAVSEEELWGPMGVVHSILGTIFEVASVLGYAAPESDLEIAMDIIRDQMGQGAQGSAAPQDTMMANQPSAPMGAMPAGPQGAGQFVQPQMGGMA